VVAQNSSLYTHNIVSTLRILGSHRLQKSLPKNAFQGVRFCIFSLGDRAYGPQKFCAAGRKLTVRLRQLGASLGADPGFGDDGSPHGGVFADLDLWLNQTLLPYLETHHPQAPRSTLMTKAARSATTSPVETCSSPYRVQVSCAETNLLSNGGDNEGSEEWMLDRYEESYRSFFQKQCPLSAYSYERSSNQRIVVYGGDMDVSHARQSSFLIGHVVENRRITATDWEQDTRHLRIEIPPTRESESATTTKETTSAANANFLSFSTQQHDFYDSLPYRAGDVAAIMPSNAAKEVTAFLKVLPQSLQGIADRELSIQFDDHSAGSSLQHFPGHGYAFWPSHCTLRGWLTFCADIHALPEREDLRALAHYCSKGHPSGTDQRNKLVSLSETKESALYADYILREKRSWADVLYDFDSLRDPGSLLSLEVLLGLLPPIRYREFSIASSPSKECLLAAQDGSNDATAAAAAPLSATQQKISIELCVAVVEGSTRLGRTYHGLCSHYLSRLTPDNRSTVRLWIRPGSFHGLPMGDSSQVLYVGAGTGVAPLRALIAERETVRRHHAVLSHNQDEAETLERDDILVFGCRKKTADFYYAEEWDALEKTGGLALLTAFSRDQWHKIYVQQVLEKAEKESRLLSRHVLERNGSIYIAGGPKMARAVKDIIVDSLSKEMKGGDEKEAQRLLSKMQQKGRFSVEAWN